VLTVPGAIAARASRGGTAPARVAEQLARLQQDVADQAAWAASS
jgi:argininosuccinate lyase